MNASPPQTFQLVPHQRLAASVAILALALCVGWVALLAPSSEHSREPDQNTGNDALPFTAIAPSSLTFEANEGQVDPRVDFVARGPGYSLLLTGDQAYVSVLPPSRPGGVGSETSGVAELVTLDLVGADPSAEAEGIEPLPGKSNYFIGSDRDQWVTGIPQYGRVRYKNIYPGIDLEYYGVAGQLEYDFIVAPGADSARIRMRLAGGEGLRLDGEGNLVLDVTAGDLVMRAPVIYQVTDDLRRPVDGRFVMHDGGHVGFELGEYEAGQTLIIDPVFEFLRYLGGSSGDYAYAVVVDSNDYIYVAGQASSADFPTVGPVQGSRLGNSDAFVAKLSPGGRSVVYSTYLGGSFGESANGIAIDRRGAAVVVGHTESASFPTAISYQDSFGGQSDAFVSRLASDGSVLQFSTFLGGSGVDEAHGVASDYDGNVFLTGLTASTNFPTKNAMKPSLTGGSSHDAFVAKVNFGGGVEYSTYIGGTELDSGQAIAIDGDNNAYVTGWTFSDDFTTVSALQPSKGDATVWLDAFVCKLPADGSALTYSTFLGGDTDDRGKGIAVNARGDMFVAGSTSSSDFPTANPIQGSQPGNISAFVARIDAAGSALEYSTYLGGAWWNDSANAIAVDNLGNAFVVGETDSTDFPTYRPLQGTAPAGMNGFVSVLNGSGSSLVYSTYLGGSLIDRSKAVALGADGSAYVVGDTESSDFPTPGVVYGSVSHTDTFIAKLSTPLDFWLAGARQIDRPRTRSTGT